MDLAEQAWTALTAQRAPTIDLEKEEPTFEVPGLGELSVRTYRAYEGRNPRTGERVAVPAKRLAFFSIADELRAQLHTDPPTLDGGAALLAECLRGRLVLFGRLGGFSIKRRAARVGRDPQTGVEVTIPSVVVLVFSPSRQLTRALNREPPAPIIDAAIVEAAIGAVAPSTLAELDVAFAQLHLEHAQHGLLAPDARTTDEDGQTELSPDENGEDGYGRRWSSDGATVFETRHDGTRDQPLASWLADAMLLARLRASAAQLSATDAARVVARLSPDTLFRVADLPF